MSSSHPNHEQLIDFVLDEVQVTERTWIQAHVQECDTCAKATRSLETVLEGSRRLADPEPPAHVLVDLLQAQAMARTRPVTHGSSRRLFTAAAAAVLLVAIFVSGFVAGRRSSIASSPVTTGVDTLNVIHPPLPEPPVIPFQTAQAIESPRTVAALGQRGDRHSAVGAGCNSEIPVRGSCAPRRGARGGWPWSWAVGYGVRTRRSGCVGPSSRKPAA